MRKFDLQAALSGAKLVTRDGREVTDFKECGRHKIYKYSAIVGGMNTLHFTENGCFSKHHRNSPRDLLLAETQTRTMWVNVYQFPDGTLFLSKYLFETIEQAEKNTYTETATYHATVQIEIP